MAPDLPAPIRGGLDLASLVAAEPEEQRKFGLAETRPRFYLQDGVYVVRPCDPCRLGHVLWGKLDFCDAMHRVLIRYGKLPETDPRRILTGLRKSLEAVPHPSEALQKRIASLLSNEAEHATFAEWCKLRGTFASARIAFEVLAEDELRKRSAENAIEVALVETIRTRPGFTETYIAALRRQVTSELEAELSSPELEASTVRAMVDQCAREFAETANRVGLAKRLNELRAHAEGIHDFTAVFNAHVELAKSQPEMAAGIMSADQLNAFASRVIENKRLSVLKASFVVDEALARSILKSAQGKGQDESALALAPTARERNVFIELLRGTRADDYHRQVADCAVDQLPRFRRLQGGALAKAMPMIQAAARAMNPSMQAKERQLVEDLSKEHGEELIQKLHMFRHATTIEVLGQLLDFGLALQSLAETASSAEECTIEIEASLFADLARASDAWSEAAKTLNVDSQAYTAWLEEVAALAVASISAEPSVKAKRVECLSAVLSNATYLWSGLNKAGRSKHPGGQQVKGIMRALTTAALQASERYTPAQSRALGEQVGANVSGADLKTLPRPIEIAMRDFFKAHTPRSVARDVSEAIVVWVTPRTGNN